MLFSGWVPMFRLHAAAAAMDGVNAVLRLQFLGGEGRRVG